MKAKDDISPERLRQLLYHDASTGRLIRRFRPEASAATNARWAGREAGTVCKDGYIALTIEGKVYRAHRVIWAMEKGVWPNEEIDHQNLSKDDNSMQNLREATIAQNKHNRAIQRNNTSGFKGVIWHKSRGCWRAQIRIDGRRIYRGGFRTPEQAHAAYCSMAAELHGEFARAS